MPPTPEQVAAGTLKEAYIKGDALMGVYDGVVIVRLRQVLHWSLEEMWRIKDCEDITDAMWQNYEELSADVVAAKRLLEYFGASTGEYDDDL